MESRNNISYFLFKLYNFKYNLFYLYNNTVVLILYVPYEIKRLTLTWFSWLNLQKLIIVARIIFFWVQEKKKVGTLMLRKTEGNFVRVKLNFYFLIYKSRLMITMSKKSQKYRSDIIFKIYVLFLFVIRSLVTSSTTSKTCLAEGYKIQSVMISDSWSYNHVI